MKHFKSFLLLIIQHAHAQAVRTFNSGVPAPPEAPGPKKAAAEDEEEEGEEDGEELVIDDDAGEDQANAPQDEQADDIEFDDDN